MVNVDIKLLVIFVELFSKCNVIYVVEKMYMIVLIVLYLLGCLCEIFDDFFFICVLYGLIFMFKVLELGFKVCEMFDLWVVINEGDIVMFDLVEVIGMFNVSFVGMLGDVLFDCFLLCIKWLVLVLQVCLMELFLWEVDVVVMCVNELDLVFLLFFMCYFEIMEEVVIFFNMWVCVCKDYLILGECCMFE